MKKIFFPIFLFFFIQNTFSQQSNASERIGFYLQQAAIALENNDPSHACKVMQHIKIYLDQVTNEKAIRDIKIYTAKICEISKKQEEEKLSKIRESLEWWGNSQTCRQYKQARTVCAHSASFEDCMTLNYGRSFRPDFCG